MQALRHEEMSLHAEGKSQYEEEWNRKQTQEMPERKVHNQNLAMVITYSICIKRKLHREKVSDNCHFSNSGLQVWKNELWSPYVYFKKWISHFKCKKEIMFSIKCTLSYGLRF